MTTRMTKRIGATAAVAAGALLALAPATANVQAAPSADHDMLRSSYTAGNKGDSLNATLKANLAKAKQAGPAAKSRLAAATVYYSVSGTPTYASYVRQNASIWNGSVSNVQLVEDNSRATLKYTEGSDPGGSYAYTDGRGNGTIFFDHSQMSQYYKLRVATHETGHALGLPDRYELPCSQLMSGGGPGPSCTNAYPASNESDEVDQAWAYGFTSSPAKVVNAAYVRR